MSNFICSECGTTWIDCGGAGYKTLKEIELEKENKRLQEQLNEANKLLKYCCANYESSRFGATITEDGEILPKGPVWNYLKKWKV